MSGFVKLYGSILESSIWFENPWTRLLWITMLAMADADGLVMASVPGLAHRARIPLDECRASLRVLESPDPDDRSGADDGRRIRVVPGGWQLVNYDRYRELRTERQVKEAERKADWRARRRGDASGHETDTRDVSQMSREVSTSASASEVDLGVGVQGKGSMGTPEIADQVYDFVGEYDFGPYTDMVLALCRLHRFPPAAVATLRAHLTGMDRTQCTTEELGVACQDYLAANGREFNPRHFEGFVRRAKGRNAQAREAREIAEVRAVREADDRDAALAAAMVVNFEAERPARAAELLAEAEALVEPEAFARSILVRGVYTRLVREEVGRARSA